MNEDLIDKVFLNKAAAADKIVFFTGAGISAESGIPTFRGKEGIWNKFRPEELANFDAFIKNPELVWEWYKYRRKIVQDAKPNPGHLAIAEFEKYFPQVTVITQNVDNLHRRAGSSSIYELHGNIERNYCITCRQQNSIEALLENNIPRCKCGGLLRPDVVWFGEMLPEDQYSGAEKAASEADIFFTAGTSAVVYPAASLVYIAKEMNSFVVELNIEETDVSSMADRSYIGAAGQLLPKLLNELKEKLSLN